MRYLIILSLLTAYVLADFSFCGVNEAGMESGNKYPGRASFDYAVIGKSSSMQSFSTNGMNIFRLPFKWERLQGTLNATLNATYVGYINQTILLARNMSAYVLLDLHNYGRYRGNQIGSAEVPYSAFYNVWYQLATTFKNYDNVHYGLMNEPNKMPDAAVVAFQNIGIRAVRDAGVKALIYVCGNDWSGAHSWMSGNDESMLNITDPLNNFVFEMHQYFDTYSSGTTADCDPLNVPNKILGAATNWLRVNNKTGFIGEMGASNDTACLSLLQQALSYMKNNSDVWKGFTYWAAGPWWGDYFFSIEPPRGASQLQIIKSVIPATYTPMPTPSPSPSTSTTARALTTSAVKTSTSTTAKSSTTSAVKTSTSTTARVVTTAAPRSTTSTSSSTTSVKSSTTTSSAGTNATPGQSPIANSPVSNDGWRPSFSLLLIMIMVIAALLT